MRTHLRSRIGSAALAALVFAAVIVSPPPLDTPLARAATFTVTKTADTNDGTCDADCSLREAIVAANATPGPDQVVVPAGTYPLTLGTIGLSNGGAGEATTITGAGAASTIIEAGAGTRVFDATGGAHRIEAVTIKGGETPGTPFGGGAILNRGTSVLTLHEVELTGNSTTVAGVHGGAIYNISTLNIERSALWGNTAAGEGGALYSAAGTVSIENSTISGNSSAQSGSAIFHQNDTMVIDSSTITDNGPGFGGVVTLASMTVGNSILAGNTSQDCWPTAGGAITSAGFNIVGVVGDGVCSISPQIGDQFGAPGTPTDPRLGPLDDFGFPTRVHLPFLDSPAVDQGFTILPLDQTGATRPTDLAGVDNVAGGNGADIGAVEGTATLQQTIDWATPGDTIKVWAGTYNENLFINKDLTLQGADDTNKPVIVNNSETATIEAGSGATLVNLVDLAVTNGADGGVRNNGTSLSIDGLDIYGNDGPAGGGGVNHPGPNGTTTITNSHIYFNTASQGAGVYAGPDGNITITDTEIGPNNVAQGVGGGVANSSFGTAGLVTITGGSIHDNYATNGGGGAYLNTFFGTLTNVSVIDNIAGDGGGLNVSGGSVAVTGGQIAGNQSGVPASTPVIDNFNPTFGTTASCGGTGPLFQGFEAISDQVSSIHLRMRRNGGTFPNPETLRIYVREGGPTGPIVAEANGYVAPFVPGGSSPGIEFLLTPALDVEPGSVYVIELDTFGSFGWYRNNPNSPWFETQPYAPSQSWAWCAGGSPVATPDIDYDFQVYAPNSAGLGGGISNGGSLDIDNTLITGNKTVGSGGGVYSNGSLTVLGGVVSSNDAGFGGGGLHNDGGFMSIGYLSGEPPTVDGVSIDRNTAGGNGGGILNTEDGSLEIEDSVLWGNDAASSFGGALYAESGFVDVTTSLIGPGNTANVGGGIYNDGDGFGGGTSLTVIDSAVVYNSAGDGGGVYNLADASLTNVTISGNDATFTGGGYVESAFQTTDLDFVTITANSSGGFAGGLFNDNGTVNTSNTIIAGNTAPTNPDCSGSSWDLGNNLIGNTGNATTSGCGFSDGLGNSIVGSNVAPVDPLLGPLATVALDAPGVNVNPTYSTNVTLEPGTYALSYTVGGAPETIEVGITLGALYSDTVLIPDFGDDVSVMVPIEVTSAGTVPLVLDDIAMGGTYTPSVDLLLIRLDGPASVHPLLSGSPAIDAGAGTLDFADFASPTPAALTLNGLAALSNDGVTDVLRINGDAGNAQGSAFLTDPLPISQNWAAEFDFRINPIGTDDADGFTFAVAPSPTLLGGSGGNLGVHTIGTTTTVVAVEFDTWVNSVGAGIDPNPFYDHVGIAVNPTTAAGVDGVPTVVIADPGVEFGDGQVRTAWIEYDATTFTLSVRLAPVGSARPAFALVEHFVDIPQALGTSSAHFGFTAGSTTFVPAQHEILRWQLSTAGDCVASDQRGVGRDQYAPCDLGAYEFETPLANPTVTLLDFSSDDPTPSSGASSIAVSDLPREALVSSGTSAANTPIGDIESAPLNSTALNSTVLNSTALNSTALNSTALNSTELDDNALDAVLLSDVGVPGGWEDVLLGTDFAGVPVQTLSLFDVLNNASATAKLASLNLSIADLDLSDTPLGSLPFVALATGTLSIADIGAGPTQVDNLNYWCGEITTAGCELLGIQFDGSGQPIPASAEKVTLLTLILSSSPVNSAALNSVALNSTALNSVALNSVALNSTPITEAALNSTALNSTALNSVALNSTALNSVALNSVALNSTALNSTALNSVALNSVALNSVALNSTALNSVALNSVALNSTALNSVALNSVALNSVALNSTALNSVALNSVALNSTALNSVALNSTALNSVALNATALNSVALNSVPLTVLETIIDCSTVDCTSSQTFGTLGDANVLPGATYGELLQAVVDTGQLAGLTYAQIIGELADAGALTGIFYAQILDDLAQQNLLGFTNYAEILGELADLDIPLPAFDVVLQELLDQGLLSTTTYAEILGALADNDLLDFTDYAAILTELVNQGILGATSYAEIVQELVDLGFFSGLVLADIYLDLLEADPNLFAELEIYLGDLFDGLVANEDLSWQDLDLDLVDLQQLSATGGSVVYTTEFEITDGSGAEDVTVTVNLPDGFILDPDIAPTLDTPASTGIESQPDVVTDTGSGLQLVWNLTAIPNGISTLSIPTRAGVALGPTSASASVAAVGNIVGGTEDLVVQDAIEPNDTFAEADLVPAQSNTLYLTHISSSNDRDIFKLGPLAEGTEITGVLGNLPADYDLVLYGPAPTKLRKGANQSASAVDDDGDDLLSVDETSSENTGDVDLLDLDIDNDGEDELVVHTISARRGTQNERIDTGPIRVAGDYYFQVTGYNGAASANPYSFRMKVVDPGSLPICLAPSLSAGTPGVSSAIPTDVNTLFLVNRQRLEAAYSDIEADAVMAAVANVAAASELGVIGAVVAVDVEAAAAYNALEVAPCSVDAANQVASAIADVVDDYRATYPTIQNVVIIGGDEQIPHFRVPDEVYLSNENTYASTFGALDDPISRALDASYLFTDDPFGDPAPIDANGREVYITEVALGRLVERPADIVQALDNFITYQGLLDPATTSNAYVTGYDFLDDGAEAVANELEQTNPARIVARLINDLWDRDDLNLGDPDGLDPNVPDEGWLSGIYSIISLNAHFDHNRAQPAVGDTGTSTLGDGLATVADVIASGPDTLEQVIIFSMGCHAGLSVSDIQIAGPGASVPGDSALERDWAQTFAEQGAVFAANSGYGYGDTEANALSELLMTYFADNLDGSMSVGEALQYAKHRYASGQLLYGAFDDKVIMQAVFYGLPMYAIGANPTTAPPVDPLPTGTDPVSGLTVAAFDVDLDPFGNLPAPDLVEQVTPRGSFYYYDADGDGQLTSVDGTQVTPSRPILPRVEIDATQPGDLQARGAILTALTSIDTPNFDPVISKATVDLSSNEPEPTEVTSFPSALQAVNTYQTKAGLRDQLVLVPGQFRSTSDTTGTQRLYTNLEGFVFYSPISETDFRPPTITEVSGTKSADQITFEVEVNDLDNDVVRVYVLYRDQNTFVWKGLDLAQNLTAGTWSGSAADTGVQKDYFVQAVDAAGNVAVSSNKADLFESGTASTPQLATVTGTEVDGWYDGSATVSVLLPSGVTAQYSTNGSTFTPYSGDFTVTGDGPIDVSIVTNVGVFETFSLQIDGAAPTVSSSLNGATFVLGQSIQYPVPTCTDSGSGIASCVGPTGPVDTATPGTFPFTATATDVVGNTTTGSFSYTVLADPPAVAINEDVTTVNEGATVTYTATPSGVTSGTTPQYQWTVLRNGGQVLTRSTPTLSFKALDDGNYEVRLRIRDAVTTLVSERATETFTALNVAPTIPLSGAATVEANTPYTLNLGTVIDPGADNVSSIFVDWGDGTSNTYQGIGNKTHTYTTIGVRTISVSLVDDDVVAHNNGVPWPGGTLTLEVTLPPAIESMTVAPDLVSILDGGVTLDAAYTGSVSTATIDWGDGTVEPATIGATITGSHTYTTSEVHQVTLTLVNSVGETATDTAFVVAYDPLGASVKGNGEIELLPGTYFADPSITGDKPKPDDDPEAKFGINAQYKKDGGLDGDNKSKLKFKVLDLDLKSLTYDWLVITGGLARYEGTLEFKAFEGQEFGFRITAIDGDLDANDTYLEDEYGIRIWDSSGTVVFDTNPGETSGTRPLLKGKVLIKPPKGSSPN